MKVNWSLPDFSEEEINAATNSLNNYIGATGPEVKLLEKEFAEKVGSKHAIAVCNGTAALVVALMCLKNKYNIKTIGVPSFTFIASANSAWNVFGKENIKLLDCSYDSWNVEKENILSGLDLLMTVDVGGLPCDYEHFSKLGIPVIADSAESLGSSINNKILGTQAEMHCFSLHRSKIVSCGEGGMITTNSDELANMARAILNHGYAFDKKHYEYKHDYFGLNFRMYDVNAAIARVQLKKLNNYVIHRNKIANFYQQELANLVQFQKFDQKKYLNNYFFFGILLDKRDQLIDHLLKNNVEIRTWTAVNKQPAWNVKDIPTAEKISDKILLLPIYNTIKENEVEYVIEKIKEFF